MTWWSFYGVLCTVALFVIPIWVGRRIARYQATPWPPPVVLQLAPPVDANWPPPVLAP